MPSEVQTAQIEIKLEDISLQYRSGSGASEVLRGLNLEIRKGEFFSLLGPSGCGKTSLLRIVADLVEPTSGRATVAGLSARQAREQHKYGMVFQTPALYPWRTVRQNVALPLELQKVPKDEREEIVGRQLRIVDLFGHAEKYPHELSGGMQQRVGIARALALNPEILLMDEPFSALDEFTKLRLHEDILRIWEQTDKTILFVTHNIGEAVYLSDRICVMSTNPARVSALIDVDLPRPRTENTLKTISYFNCVTKARGLLEENFNENL